jgi:mevalonate kinase
MQKSVATIPAKIMLAGEYSVLQGGQSLSFTLNRYLTASLETFKKTSGEKTLLQIFSNLWKTPHLLTSLQLSFEQKQVLLLYAASEAVNSYRLSLPLKLSIDSQIQVQDGMGSSSALLLAIFLAAKQLSQNQNLSQDDALQALRAAYGIQKYKQQQASGYDFINQCYGGLIHYQPRSLWPEGWQQLSGLKESVQAQVHIFVGGKGAPTDSVSRQTLEALRQLGYLSSLTTLSDQLIDSLVTYLQQPQETARQQAFFLANKKLRQLFEPTPHFPMEVKTSLQQTAGLDETWTYKTTGAGGEDALLLFGDEGAIAAPQQALQKLGWKRFSYELVEEGARIDKKP